MHYLSYIYINLFNLASLTNWYFTFVLIISQLSLYNTDFLYKRYFFVFRSVLMGIKCQLFIFCCSWRIRFTAKCQFISFKNNRRHIRKISVHLCKPRPIQNPHKLFAIRSIFAWAPNK